MSPAAAHAGAIFFPLLSCCLRSPGRLPASASSVSCRWETPAARPLLRSAAFSATVSMRGSSPISRRSADNPQSDPQTNPQSNPQSAIRNPQWSPRPTASSCGPPRRPTFRLPTRGRCAWADRWRLPPAFASAISTPTSGRPSASSSSARETRTRPTTG